MSFCSEIIKDALSGIAPEQKSAVELLKLAPDSVESVKLRDAANTVSHRRFMNKAMLLSQIGIEKSLCSGGCKFCSMNRNNPTGELKEFDAESVLTEAEKLSDLGVDAVFFMATADFPFEKILNLVSRCQIRAKKVVNIGDCSLSQYQELKSAGVSGAYHVLRLREGEDTELLEKSRRLSIENIIAAGLNWYNCCEPIGPEHSNLELAKQIYLGNEYGCFQHAAMSRVNFSSSLLSRRGEITVERLAQIVAVTTLASLANNQLQSIAVHEPNLPGIFSGANSVYAEYGSNPRDVVAETLQGRGRDVTSMRQLLREGNWLI